MFAVLADPVFGPGDSRIPPGRPRYEATAADSPTSWPRDLPRLPFAGHEALKIASLLPPQEVFVATGFDATRDTVLQDGLGTFSIIHFATHGILDARNPERSGLALSALDRAGRPLDAMLRPTDIDRLQLSADLVVLASCQTGLRLGSSDVWPSGLAQSFLAAGARSVLVSL